MLFFYLLLADIYHVVFLFIYFVFYFTFEIICLFKYHYTIKSFLKLLTGLRML